MADDNELTRERQRLLDQIEECNELLARLGVPTRLPMSLAQRYTTAELGREEPLLWRFYQQKRHELGGLV